MRKFFVNRIKAVILIIFSFVLALNCLTLSVGATAEDYAVNIPNSNFETFIRASGSSVYKKPEGWDVGFYVMWISQAETSVSGYSLKVNSGIDFSLSTEDYVSITGGIDYKFGYYAKSESGDNSVCSITINTFDDNKATLNTYRSEDFTVNENDWTEISGVFSLDQSVNYVKIELNVKTDTSACFVDQVFGEVSQEEIETPTLTTHFGASLRLVKDSPGIRFSGCVDKTLYDSFLLNYSNVSAGIIITPNENLEVVADFTASELSDKGKAFAEIPAQKWNNTSSAEQDGFYGFYCALTNIRPQNIKREFAFRTYFKYTDGETEHVVYGNFDSSENVRSVYDIACSAYEDLSLYSQTAQEIITYYATYQSE